MKGGEILTVNFGRKTAFTSGGISAEMNGGEISAVKLGGKTAVKSGGILAEMNGGEISAVKLGGILGNINYLPSAFRIKRGNLGFQY